MKTKLFALLTSLTTLTTVVAATAPAQAGEIDDLMDAFYQFAPTQDRMKIQSDGVNLKEFDLTGPLTVNQYNANLEAVFLGEAAGSTKNVLDFSVSSGDSNDKWSNIFAYKDDILDKKDPNNIWKVGSFNKKSNGQAGLDIGSTLSLGEFQAGSTLDFALGRSNDASFGFSLSSAPGQFKGYTLAGFEDWMIIGLEDNNTATSDWDYNDAVFAVKLGTPAASVPEPSMIAALMGVSAAFGISRRKNANKS
jgi:hypothetical protein